MMQKYPPTSKFVRAVSILTGYFIKATGPTSCIFTYLSQADPKGGEHKHPPVTENLFCSEVFANTYFLFFSVTSGLIPKVVVNTATKMLAPNVRPCLISEPFQSITSCFSAALTAMRTVCVCVSRRWLCVRGVCVCVCAHLMWSATGSCGESWVSCFVKDNCNHRNSIEGFLVVVRLATMSRTRLAGFIPTAD